jgi:CspA family cold shock protein
MEINPKQGGVMTVGKVKWYDEFKGYGYILQMDGLEVYFHYTSIAELTKDLGVGSIVAYDLIETRQGWEAANIRRTAS